MTKPIAPTLRTVVKMAVARKSPGSYVAQRELFALLAAARAARGHLKQRGYYESAMLRRALARLERAGGRG